MCFMARGSPSNGSATTIYIFDACNKIGFYTLKTSSSQRATGRENITHEA